MRIYHSNIHRPLTCRSHTISTGDDTTSPRSIPFLLFFNISIGPIQAELHRQYSPILQQPISAAVYLCSQSNWSVRLRQPSTCKQYCVPTVAHLGRSGSFFIPGPGAGSRASWCQAQRRVAWMPHAEGTRAVRVATQVLGTPHGWLHQWLSLVH
jgi:hypothetical protein